MKLSKIIEGMKCKEICNYVDLNIECLTHESKECIDGSIFFAIEGMEHDGKMYVQEAVKKGAKVIVSSQKLDIKIVNIVVDNVRKSMSIMAKNFYNKSDEKLQKIAIVGTNGKTTSSFVLGNILKEYDKKVGIIGTNGIYINGECLPNNMTTPDPIELHYIFSQMVMFGVQTVVMEVSAHAIFLDKLYGIKFDIGLFTNISNEHLDFFHNMENYANTKVKFFNKKYMKECVSNIDDLWGVRIAKKANIPVVSYGIYNPSNIFAVDIKINISGSNFFVNIDDEIIDISTGLVGEYNIYNILGCIGVAKLLGVDNYTIKMALKKQKAVDGRFNVFSLSNNKKIIVDFAHTPDGFDKVLSVIKKLRKGKIITVFGCVGYSDAIKRKCMGEVASKYSDKIVITTDNLGNAIFEHVVEDILKGIDCNKPVDVVFDREEAIKKAYHNLKNNDTLVILGKGAETKQVIGDKILYYSDLDCVNNLIKDEIVE